MQHYLYPDKEINSTYEIDFQKFYKKGYRGIIFDVDNTLVPHGMDADQRAKDLFQTLHRLGFQTILLSNNKQPRVKKFSDAVHSKYIFKAGKPSAKNYFKAMEQMHTKAETTIFVGDQIFTDIWGANNACIYSILVRPIHPKEEIQIVLKRYLEKLILWKYHRYIKKRNG